MDYSAFPQERVKHLEMIQAVVSRLANEAALIRGWTLTVTTAFFAFAAQSWSWRIAGVGLLPVLAFWGLNGYYLRVERQYRKLYERVRAGDATIKPFEMDARDEMVATWWNTLWSPTLKYFYGVIFVVGIALILAGVLGVRTSSARGSPDAPEPTPQLLPNDPVTSPRQDSADG